MDDWKCLLNFHYSTIAILQIFFIFSVRKTLKETSKMIQYQTSFTKYFTLVAENQANQKTVVKRIQLEVMNGKICIKQIVTKGQVNYEGRLIRIYDFQADKYNEIQADSQLPLVCVTTNNSDLVLIKIGARIQSIKSQSAQQSKDPSKQSQTSSLKKQRSKQRVIFEVISIVKKWRVLHQGRNSLKKMSLLEAAKTLGMPKKSLDDYYHLLRLAQKYGFDFQTHLFDRVGVLRTFIKNYRGNSTNDKYQRHSQNLKIMEIFDEVSELFYNGNKIERSKSKSRIEEQMIEENIQNLENPSRQEINQSRMNEFKDKFAHLSDEKDPFLVGQFNFKKKIMKDLEQDQIFY